MDPVPPLPPPGSTYGRDLIRNVSFKTMVVLDRYICTGKSSVHNSILIFKIVVYSAFLYKYILGIADNFELIWFFSGFSCSPNVNIQNYLH